MTIALSKDFLLAFSNVQKSHQKKVREFFERFQVHPESDGINYEPIQSARDKNFYSVRIDQAYRAVIAKPDPNVYVLMWVDHHDEAYRWAERKRLEVHPATGAVQVLDMTAVPVGVAAAAPVAAAPRLGALFASVKNKHLLQLGVPEELLPVVRSMDIDADLERAESAIPQEAYEALFLLASGYNLDQVFGEMQKPQEEPPAVDTTDYGKALLNEDSQRRFHIVEGSRELAEILTAPLEQWRIFLHPKQRQLVRMRAGGPVRVLGGAGTGKTVVAMHRARYLAEEVFTGKDDRVLFTTFTKNLATDISQNLRKLCGDETAWARIEVQHLDGWVANFLRTQGYRPEIVYNADNDCWRNALDQAPAESGLHESFYRVEWESVVQAQNITSVDEYLAAARIGRGTRLSRDMKKKIWPVFQEYRAQLNEGGKKEYVDLIRDARQFIENKALKLPYRAVIVDEAQDLSAEAFRLVRTIAPAGENDLFIVGDAHQRIYRHRVTLGKCGIDIRGRGKKLKINYRTTDEIRRFAVRLLEGRPIDDLDGGQDDQKGYMSLTHGTVPAAMTFASAAEEASYLRQHIQALVAEGSPLESICVVARTKKLVENYAAHLRASGIETYEVKRDTAEQRDRAGVRIATMHRVKGLEFEHIIVAGANRGIVPLDMALAVGDDAITQRNLETGERALLYVALTRAKRSALITSYGDPSPYLSAAP
jgi:superfamily I DNA/RNA helicase/Txe/YoeB family toxin of Txe-Axe toxin-antitoxin module